VAKEAYLPQVGRSEMPISHRWGVLKRCSAAEQKRAFFFGDGLEKGWLAWFNMT